MHPATVLAQLDHVTDGPTGGLVPALHPALTHVLPGEAAAVGYARSTNSGARAVEALVAKLEGGAAAAAFTSGSAAMQAVLAGLSPGDHVLLDTGIYYEFGRIIVAFGARWQIAVSFADFCELDSVAAALLPGRTKLVWAECPSNPLWRVPDMSSLADLTHAAGAKLLVDATVITPVLCHPLSLGADLVLHSATKYLNGHGDVLAGVLVTADADNIWAELVAARTAHGSILPPFEAWLLLRGLRTLAVRMARCSQTALAIAEALQGHAAIAAVHYPGLADDPHHALARAQFQAGFGGMLSLTLKGGEADAIKVCARLQVFRQSTSLGGPESLAEHRLSTEGAGSLCPPALIRLSIGLEEASDLLGDLRAALACD
ncbi:PLP-dependent transferase [Acidisoma cellulosilytica]|uniref:PLP-dependent transferase n=1 Tax=Acidisoma cellulosilyticum TaxID=2802395 RepID=A0A963Z5F1_9PROT|nr:PLP-dependent aspartate aminotransferase family protein [Acidisoma cellulosilyticum]MCB8882143.1 PLP-dependent transferase [Acidisoma cellulosilyticum]